MPRARNIKPGFFKNEELAECSPWARLCFAGLWTLADRDGRLEDRPKRIKAELFAFDTEDVEPMLQELEARKFIARYIVDGVALILIPTFKKHQSPHYSEKPSGLKPHPTLERESDEGEASRGVVQGNSGSGAVMKRGSQPPDSLIPDSLIPDSLIPDVLKTDHPTSDQPTNPSSTANQLSDRETIFTLGRPLLVPVRRESGVVVDGGKASVRAGTVGSAALMTAARIACGRGLEPGLRLDGRISGRCTHCVCRGCLTAVFDQPAEIAPSVLL